MERTEISPNSNNEKENKGNKNKKFVLKYMVEKENTKTELFSSNFIANNKGKCYLIIDGNESELNQNYVFSQKGEHIVILVLTDDNINFTKMFSTYSYSHFSGSFSSDYNSYLVDISGLGNLDVSKCKDLCGMFNGRNNIKNFDCLKNWNVSNCLNF